MAEKRGEKEPERETNRHATILREPIKTESIEEGEMSRKERSED
jgi:hypothetical protein